ncbi:MAG: hypothetical protein U5K31_00490 [Balneolaceae bacterium]|nr:hypothetical protein [Balneolaceae bacterium]
MVNRELKAASAKPMVLPILSHGESYRYRMISDELIRSNCKVRDSGCK